MSRNKYRGRGDLPFKPSFNPKPKKVFRFKVEKILGSLYLTRPLLERMDIKAIIDSIVPERKENGQIITTGQVSELLVANRLHHPLPLKDIEDWAELCGIEQLYGVKPENLNDDRLGRALDDLDHKKRLEDIALNKLNKRRYKDKDYAQKQVDNCFKGSKHYLRKVFNNPTVEEKKR